VRKIFVCCKVYKCIVSNNNTLSFKQPDTMDPDGVNHKWHIPITAHVVISLSLASRLTGVCLNSFTA